LYHHAVHIPRCQPTCTCIEIVSYNHSNNNNNNNVLSSEIDSKLLLLLLDCC